MLYGKNTEYIIFDERIWEERIMEEQTNFKIGDRVKVVKLLTKQGFIYDGIDYVNKLMLTNGTVINTTSSDMYNTYVEMDIIPGRRKIYFSKEELVLVDWEE